MPLLIDGYNLLHVTGIVGHGKNLSELHRSREALLTFLAQSIKPAERTHTTIVFDAAGAPPGLPPTIVHDAITVHFARDYADADGMLEDLIAAHPAPRTLVVVSSDHRVQRAAKRRRAKAVDSDRWYAELWAARHRRNAPTAEPPPKPVIEQSPGEVEYWMKQFDAAPTNTEPASRRKKKPKPTDDIDDPFPPGYGDDLLDGEK
jgi:predicted RNA-binding protein with PIN domain